MLINRFRYLLSIILHAKNLNHTPFFSFFIYSNFFSMSLSLFFCKFCCIVYVWRFIEKRREKKRNAWRKMNVTASKASLVLLCSIQHSNYISPYVESAAWTDRTKLFRWLRAMKQATSIHLYCVLSSYRSHPIKFVVRDAVKKNSSNLYVYCWLTANSGAIWG